MSFTVINGTNREWTTTEEADLLTDYGVNTPNIAVIVNDDYALVYKLSDEAHNCLLWALQDNLYAAKVTNSDKIYWSNSLKDAFDFAAEAVNLLDY